MNKTTRKILKISSYIIVAIAVLFATIIVGIKAFGLQIYTVLSGSMEPELKVGSIIYVEDIDPNTLNVGDIITYKLSSNTLSTHRITEILVDEENPEILHFKTKGDANKDEDALTVEIEDIKGRVVFDIPYLGYLVSYIQAPPGNYVAIAVGGLLIAYVFFVDAITSEKKDKKKEITKSSTSE